MDEISEEIWKVIPNTNGYYEVSNKGNIVSYHKGYRHILKPSITKKGYLRLSISFCDGKKRKFVHRIVAESFLENTLGYNEVNHKDGNKLNNNVDNLEFCSSKYNSWHKFNVLGYVVSCETRRKLSQYRKGKRLSDELRAKISIGHLGKKRSKESVLKTAMGHMKKVAQLDKEGNMIAVFNSIKEASNATGTMASEISSVCNGRRKTAKGCIWKFINKKYQKF